MRNAFRLLRNIALPVTAAGLIAFAVLVVERPSARTAEPFAPPASPAPTAAQTVAAVGLVEPNSETIAVSVDTPGVVREILVRPGDDVTSGQPLFRLDARAILADLQRARAARQVAHVGLADARARARLFADVSDPRAISGDQLDRATFAVRRAEADLGLAEAEVERLNTELELRTIRAPISGQVLRLNVRPGEYAVAGGATPLMTLGAVDPLHIRAQIDEEDAVRVATGAPATATLRGDGSRRFNLTFVRFEPQAQPKRNLNGGGERVDTRVVEAIYAFEPGPAQVFVGQQVDVFIEARSSRNSSR